MSAVDSGKQPNPNPVPEFDDAEDLTPDELAEVFDLTRAPDDPRHGVPVTDPAELEAHFNRPFTPEELAQAERLTAELAAEWNAAVAKVRAARLKGQATGRADTHECGHTGDAKRERPNGQSSGGVRRGPRVLADAHAILGRLVSAPGAHDLLEVEMAVALDAVLHDGGKPIWLIPIGPSGAGKNEVAASLKGAHTKFVSELASSASFLSGAIDPKSHRPARALLDELNGHCVVLKDLAAALSDNPDKARAILGKLCDIFDGEYSKGVGTSFGTSALLESKSRFSMIANATPQLWRKHQRLVEDIGTRALHVIMPPLTAEQRRRGYELVKRPDRSRVQVALRGAVNLHLKDVIGSPGEVQVPADIEAKLQRLAELISVGRTPINWEWITTEDDEGKERQKRVWSPGEREEPYRAHHQLRRLLILLTRLNGRTQPSGHEMRLVHWVALSSVSLDRAKVLLAMRRSGDTQKGRRGITVETVMSILDLGEDQARHRLDELVRIKLLERLVPPPYAEPRSDGSVGPHPSLYAPVPEFEAPVFEELPDTTVYLG